MKPCVDCGIEKPDEAFRKGRRGCIECERVKGRAYEAANKAKRAAKNKAYALKNQARLKAREAARYRNNVEYFAVHNKAWREKNSGYDARYRVENKAIMKVRRRNWRVANPDKSQTYWANRRAAIMAPDAEKITGAVWQSILEWFGRRCAYCLEAGHTLAMDHVIPLSRGGRHAVENIVPACITCNSAKGNRPVFMMAGKS